MFQKQQGTKKSLPESLKYNKKERYTRKQSTKFDLVFATYSDHDFCHWLSIVKLYVLNCPIKQNEAGMYKWKTLFVAYRVYHSVN